MTMKRDRAIRINGGKRLTVDIEGPIGLPQDGDVQQAATYEKFREQIDRIGRSGAQQIWVNIRSTGGDIHDALLMYEALCALAAEGAEITTLCYGYTASAATVVAQAASPGRRLVSANALYLIHNSVTAVEGNCQDAERAVQLLDKTDERIAEIYAARSGRDLESFRALMARNGGRGEWLSAAETVAAGLADRVYRPSPLSAAYDKVAETVRGMFRGRRNEESGTEQTVPEIAVCAERLPPETAERPAGTGSILRSQVKASATRPCEDPAVVAAGLPGDAFGNGCSRNGSAYENDAARIRTDC